MHFDLSDAKGPSEPANRLLTFDPLHFYLVEALTFFFNLTLGGCSLMEEKEKYSSIFKNLFCFFLRKEVHFIATWTSVPIT